MVPPNFLAYSVQEMRQYIRDILSRTSAGWVNDPVRGLLPERLDKIRGRLQQVSQLMAMNSLWLDKINARVPVLSDTEDCDEARQDVEACKRAADAFNRYADNLRTLELLNQRTKTTMYRGLVA